MFRFLFYGLIFYVVMRALRAFLRLMTPTAGAPGRRGEASGTGEQRRSQDSNAIVDAEFEEIPKP